MDTVIRLQGVQKTYRSVDRAIPLLMQFDLTVARAEFLAVTGPSGAGKSTLLHLIGGIDVPDAGDVTVAGTALDELDARALTRWRAAHVAFVFQSHYLLPMLTAQDNVELPLLLTNLSRSERRRKATDALARLGLADKSGHRPAQLSGGQQQRVGIARAIVADTPILLCDEPTADLDRATAATVLALLRELSQQGRTLVMATHDPVAVSAADRRFDLASAA